MGDSAKIYRIGVIPADRIFTCSVVRRCSNFRRIAPRPGVFRLELNSWRDAFDPGFFVSSGQATNL